MRGRKLPQGGAFTSDNPCEPAILAPFRRRCMSPLTTRLAERIAQQGPLTFADFMAAALYDPEHGYYASGRAVLGREGDYFTNVSVGPLFGTLLLRQFAEMWRLLGTPERFTVVEQGAHSGDLAADVWSAAERLEPDFARALRYVMVEPLARARAGQQARLSPWGERVRWVEEAFRLEPFTGVHFSNELIDAFPVHVVRRGRAGWQERRVAWREGLAWEDSPLSGEALARAVALLPQDLPAGYQTEINLHAGEWLQAVAERLRRGWVVAIDYGYLRAEYYRPERTGGTLSAYAQHQRVEDPLQNPGEVDLTAHVDWTSLMEAGAEAGLQPLGLIDQHHFMVGLMPLHFRDAAAAHSADEQKELRAFKTLMHPNLLGMSFKVIGFAKGLGQPGGGLSGFKFARECVA